MSSFPGVWETLRPETHFPIPTSELLSAILNGGSRAMDRTTQKNENDDGGR